MALEMVNTRVTDIQPDEMPNEERLAYADALRNEKPWYKERLIRLKDEVTIDEVVREWAASEGRHRSIRQNLKRSASPWMIPELAEFLYHDELPAPRSYPNPEMGHDYGFSDATALVMFEILHRAPEVPEAVRGWATPRPRSERPFPVPEMRRWWEENREHLENERYDLIEPLAEPILESDFYPRKPGAAPSDSTEETVASTEPDASAPANPEGAPVTAETTTGEQPGSPRWILWTGAGLVVLTAGVLLARRRH